MRFSDMVKGTLSYALFTSLLGISTGLLGCTTSWHTVDGSNKRENQTLRRRKPPSILATGIGLQQDALKMKYTAYYIVKELLYVAAAVEQGCIQQGHTCKIGAALGLNNKFLGQAVFVENFASKQTAYAMVHLKEMKNHENNTLYDALDGAVTAGFLGEEEDAKQPELGGGHSISRLASENVALTVTVDETKLSRVPSNQCPYPGIISERSIWKVIKGKTGEYNKIACNIKLTGVPAPCEIESSDFVIRIALEKGVRVKIFLGKTTAVKTGTNSNSTYTFTIEEDQLGLEGYGPLADRISQVEVSIKGAAFHTIRKNLPNG